MKTLSKRIELLHERLTMVVTDYAHAQTLGNERDQAKLIHEFADLTLKIMKLNKEFENENHD